MLPAASVAVHVTVVTPSPNVLPLDFEHVAVSDPLTASVALTLKVTGAPAVLVAVLLRFAGTVTTGAVVSWTRTVNVDVPVLEWVSVEEQVTVVDPIGNVDPLAGRQPTGPATSSMSAAV